MSTRRRVSDLSIRARNLQEPQRPEYQRMFDEYVTADVHLFVDGAELEYRKHLPARMDLTDTLTAFHERSTTLFESGHDEGEWFCCSCGVRGCAYIHWETELDGDEVLLTMSDLSGNPIGAHEYVVGRDDFVTALTEPFETLLEFMERRDIDSVSRGTRTDFRQRRDALLSNV